MKSSRTGSSASPDMISTIITVMFALNIFSLLLYASEWHQTGQVRTTSGSIASGHHEAPAILAFGTFAHQFLARKSGNMLHRILGYAGIASAVICLPMALGNLESGILKLFVWVDSMPIKNELLKYPMLVWNEAVNTHQYFMYGVLLLNELFQGYQAATRKQYVEHRDHMCAATIYILGPLSQRFTFNHLTDRQDKWGTILQAVTYTALMMALDCSIARKPLRTTLGIALVLAVGFVYCDSSSLRYLLASVTGK